MLFDLGFVVDTLGTGTYQVRRTPRLQTKMGRRVDAVLADQWLPDHVYTVDAQVINVGGAYVCTQGGTSGSAGEGGPSGTGTGIGDNDCLWDWIGPAVEVFSTTGSLQPLSGDQMDRLPEGLRAHEVRAFYSKDKLRVVSPDGGADQVVVDGLPWEVQKVEDWSSLAGYSLAYISRPGR